MDTDQAVALARAVAAAYASAVEGSRQHPPARRVSAMAANRAAPDRTPRRKGGADTPRGLDAGSPRFRTGVATPRRAVAARRPAAGSAASPAAVPRRFAASVSALSAVPCVQPELVRALRAVLDRFPQAPVAALRRADPEDRGREAGGGEAGENVLGGGGGEMAPPPPRPPSGNKKRRVSLDTGGLRAAAAGGDSGGGGGGGGDRLLGSGLRKRGRGSPAAAEGSSVNPRRTAPLGEKSGSGWPSAFSRDSAAREAVEAVLARAREALVFFGTAGASVQERASAADLDRGGGGGGGGEAALGGAHDGRQRVDGENGTPAGGLQLLLQHTAAVTCALRMLSPFVETARVEALGNGVDAAGRRLEFGGKWQSRAASTPRVTSAGKRSLILRQANSASDGNMPGLIDQLVDALASAVTTVARCKADRGKDSGQGRKNASPADAPPTPPPVTPGTAAPRVIGGLWEMIVSCAAELPASLLVRRPPGGGNGAGGGGGGGSRDESQACRAEATVGFAAEKALECILAPGWVRADGAWEGSASTGTVLRPGAAFAPFPLRCFLLAAAVPTGWGRGDITGALCAAGGSGSKLGDQRSAGLRKSDDYEEEEERPKKKRAHGDVRGRGSGGTAADDGDGGERGFGVEEAFLAGLRHEGSALVTQCAVAALPALSLCCTERGDCSSSSSSSGGGGAAQHFTEHAATCTWKTRWLPALLALCENDDDGGHRGSEAVRLELAAGLLRFGASLDRSARLAGSSTADGAAATAAALPRKQRPGHRPHPGNGGGPPLGAPPDEAPVGPNVFVDMLPLWPRLLKDRSVVVRAAAARAVLAAAAAAPLPRLRAAGAAGAAVLRLITDMLACGDPEVAWVVAGGAGQFVADGAKMLRAMYHYKAAGAARGGEEMDAEEEEDEKEEEEEEEEDTCDAQEEEERDVRSREKALSRFIKTIGRMLQEHGDRLRLGRWQSLHEFTALLTALG